MRRAGIALGLITSMIVNCKQSDTDPENRIGSARSAVVIDDQRANTFPTGTFLMGTGRRYIAYAGTSNHKVNVISSSSTPPVNDANWSAPLIFDDDEVNSDGAVSITHFKGKLYYAFNGTDLHINIRSSADGITWTKEVIANATSQFAPALVAHGGRLVVAYTGEDNQLNVFSSPDGDFHSDANQDDKRVLGEETPHAPALASFNGKLYLGWTGTGENKLNWMEVVSFGDGGTRDHVVLDETSDDGVGLLGLGDKFIVSWRGSGNSAINYASLNVAQVAALTSQGGDVDLPGGTKVTIGDESDHTPTFADFDTQAALLWTGTDSDQHLNITGGVFTKYEVLCGDGTLSSADSDNDGLFDCWESQGIDTDADRAPDLDLKALQANPAHRDIFVEVDAFACSAGGCAPGDNHSHRPVDDAVNAVVNAFAAAPLGNPDGTNGINLHVQRDEELAHMNNCAFDGSCFDVVKSGRFGTTAERGALNRAAILLAKRLSFHYALWVHNLEPARGAQSGKSDLPGNDFIVSLGSWTDQKGTVLQQAGTFMHELGHNLNLRHGGGEDTNNKPNYLSVMNYAFQTIGLQPFGNLDYSTSALPQLVEQSYGLSEPTGVGDGINATRFFCPNFSRVMGPAAGAIDWNCNDVLTDVNVRSDINGDRACVGPGSTPTFESTLANDDVIQGGTITPGPGGKFETVPALDDVMVGDVIFPGTNGFLDSIVPAGSNDIRSGETINDGPDFTCNTTAAPNDQKIRDVGDVEPTFLNGYEDWGNLLYNFRNTASFEEGVHEGGVSVEEIDFPTAIQIENNSIVADVSLMQLVSSSTVIAGTTFSYAIQLANDGPRAALLPTINDRLPPNVSLVSCAAPGGTCRAIDDFHTVVFDNLAVFGTASAVLTVALGCDVPDGALVSNTALVATASFDPNTADNAATSTFTAQIAAPTIHDLSVNPTILWTPNHVMTPVTVSYTVTDPCDPAPQCSSSVASNQANGSHEPDWVVQDAHHVTLRAERDGSGLDRVYTITVTCQNNKGKSSSQATFVTVSHDQR